MCPFEVRITPPASAPAARTTPLEVRTSTGPATPAVVTCPFEVTRSRAAPGGTSTTALAERFLELGRKHHLPVIEDAAQAHLGEWRGRKLGYVPRRQNAALAFVPLKDWSERKGAAHSAQSLAGRAFGALFGIRDAFIFALSPPSIPELGTATGFNFRLQDRGGNGRDALIAARNQLLGMASQSKLLEGILLEGV